MKTRMEENGSQIAEEISNSDFFKKFGYEGTWVSGSSTVVYPIMVWKGTIDINLRYCKSNKGRSVAFRRLLKRLQKRFPDLTGRFVKLDGSCPDAYVIYFK